jgi:hypothetical protein
MGRHCRRLGRRRRRRPLRVRQVVQVPPRFRVRQASPGLRAGGGPARASEPSAVALHPAHRRRRRTIQSRAAGLGGGRQSVGPGYRWPHRPMPAATSSASSPPSPHSPQCRSHSPSPPSSSDPPSPPKPSACGHGARRRVMLRNGSGRGKEAGVARSGWGSWGRAEGGQGSGRRAGAGGGRAFILTCVARAAGGGAGGRAGDCAWARLTAATAAAGNCRHTEQRRSLPVLAANLTAGPTKQCVTPSEAALGQRNCSGAMR